MLETRSFGCGWGKLQRVVVIKLRVINHKCTFLTIAGMPTRCCHNCWAQGSHATVMGMFSAKKMLIFATPISNIQIEHKMVALLLRNSNETWLLPWKA